MVLQRDRCSAPIITRYKVIFQEFMA
ncbi:unnamed protein product, partial [Didymodactylos carnosus]